MRIIRAGGRAAAGAATLVVMIAATATIMAPSVRAADDPEEQIQQIAQGAIESMQERADAYDDYLMTGPTASAAQAELTSAITEVEALAVAADADITAVMLRHPLDPNVQQTGTEVKEEVHSAAADIEASMSAAYATYVAGLPPPTTTTTLAPTTTTTLAPTTTTTLATTTTTAVTTTTTDAATTTTAPLSPATPPATTPATTVAAPSTTSTTTTQPSRSESGPADRATAQSSDASGAADTIPADGRSEPLEASGDSTATRPEPQSLASLASRLQSPSRLPAMSEPTEPSLVTSDTALDLGGMLRLLRVRLPGRVSAPLGDIFTVLQAFGLAFVSGVKSIALPAAALGVLTVGQNIVRSHRGVSGAVAETPTV